MTTNPSSQTMRIDISPDLAGGSLAALAGVSRPSAPATPVAGEFQPLDDPSFQQLFQSVYDAAIITELDGRIADVNTRAMDFFAGARASLCRLTILKVISGAPDNLVKMLTDSLAKDRFILIYAWCCRLDGTLFPTEIAVNRMHVGDREYLCFFVRDITLRRKAEEQLQSVNNAIQNASTGIAIAALDGRIEYANPAAQQFWGYSRTAEMNGGLTVRDLFSSAEKVEEMIRAVSEGQNWSGELLARHRDGAETWVQTSAAGNRAADERLVGMVLSFLDISDRKRAEEAELKAERHRVMMQSLGGACHHLSQPATVLLASLELMRKVHETRNPMLRDLLDCSMEAAEQLRKMLHELNNMTEYRTIRYMEGDKAGKEESRILDV